jgi:uncharacterized protein with PQ loop repeat
MTIRINVVEIIGYVGGLCLAFASLPQIAHTYQTRSMQDIAYSWHITTIVGLILSCIYFLIHDVTAAWVTSFIELGLMLIMLVMKIHLDTCGKSATSVPTESGSHHCKMVDLSIQRDEESGDTFSSTESDDSTHDDSSECSHVLIKTTMVGLDDQLGPALRQSIEQLALRRKQPVEWCQWRMLNGNNKQQSDDDNGDCGGSVQSFTLFAALSDHCIAVHGCRATGLLTVDLKSNVPDPECRRLLIIDIVHCLQALVPPDAKCIIHYIP